MIKEIQEMQVLILQFLTLSLTSCGTTYLLVTPELTLESFLKVDRNQIIFSVKPQFFCYEEKLFL